jgi:hypothetical protein
MRSDSFTERFTKILLRTDITTGTVPERWVRRVSLVLPLRETDIHACITD